MQSNTQTIKHSNNARPGFTILELLVASLLLGMLMTILTMIFSQSSIAWRTGVAGVSKMDDARKDISDVRYQADNVYEWDGEHYVQSVFDNTGRVRTKREDNDGYLAKTFVGTGSVKVSVPTDNDDVKQSYRTFSPRAVQKKGGDNYIVNVMSCGPDRNESTRYDNIYSVSPTDSPSEW